MSNYSDIGLRAVLELGNYVQNSKTFIERMNAMTDSTVKMMGKTASAISSSSKETSKFQQLVERAKSITYGILVADIFRDIAGGVRDAVVEAAEAVSYFQKLKIQMDTLAARDYAHTYGVTVAEALKETSAQSENLLRWVRELAVVTPFSVEKLAEVTALSNAYGFTIPEVKELTLAVGNFTAGMGLGDDVLKRIVYNLGQMMAQGKPTGRELRDLSNSFVPIGIMQERFAKQLGVSKAAVIDMMKTGEISAKQFADEFIEMVNEDFPGAMDRMSDTFATAISNIHDLFQSLLGYEIMGPLADKLAKSINDIIGSLLTDETYRKASQIGETLLFAFERAYEGLAQLFTPLKEFFALFDTGEDKTFRFARGLLTIVAYMNAFAKGLGSGVTALTNFIKGLFEKFGTNFGKLKSDLYNWGANLVISFAKGMASAIVAVLNVIKSIGLTISRLLKSHSPPLLLPELEQWGTNAMMSYMEGWSKANFDVFNDIGSLLENAIRSWEGRLSDSTIINNIISSRVELSKLTEEYKKFGVISSQALTSLSNSAGIASDQLNEYIVTSFKLMEAQGVKDALSSLLGFEGVGTAFIFDTLVDSFDDIVQLAPKFGELSDEVLQYVDYSKRLLEVNNLIKETQDEMNKSSEQYTSLLDELQAKLNKINDRQDDIGRIRVIDRTLSKVILTAYERERLELEKQEILVKRQIRDTETQKDTVDKTFQAKLDGYEAEKKAIEDNLKTQEKIMTQISDRNVAKLQTQLDILKSMIEAQIQLNELYSKSVSGSGDAGDLINADEIYEEMKAAFENAISDIDIQGALDALWLDVQAKVAEKVQELKDIFKPVGDSLGGIFGVFSGIFKDPEFTKNFNEVWNTLSQSLSSIGQTLTSTGIADSLGKLIGSIVTNLFLTTDKTGKSVLQIIADSILAIADTLNKNKDSIIAMIDSITSFMTDKAFPALKDFLIRVGTEVIPWLIEFAIKAVPFIMDVLGFIVENYKPILAVLGAIRLLGLVKDTAASGLLSVGKALMFIVGGLSILSGMKPAAIVGSLLTGLGAKAGAGAVAGAGAGAGAATGVGAGVPPALPTIAGPAVAAAGIGLGPIIAMIVSSIVAGGVTWAADTIVANAIKIAVGEDPGPIFTYLDEKLGLGLTEWITGKFGPDSDFQIKMKRFWDDIFGVEGHYTKGIDKAFSPEDGLVTESLRSFFGDGGTLEATIGVAHEKLSLEIDKMYGKDGKFVKAVNETFSGDKGLVKEAITKASDPESELMKAFYNMGDETSKGFTKGITDQRTSVFQQIRDFYLGIIKEVKSILGISSPSKVFEGIGLNVVKGFERGLAYSSTRSGTYSSYRNSTSNDNRVYINMSPTYQNTPSQSSIYYDLSAALASIRN